MEEKYYTKNEVAENLNISIRTIERYIRSGELKALKIGKYTRIEENDLKEFLLQRKNEKSIKRSSLLGKDTD